ncbi:hypothetical protein EVAR_36097_1 [Eumeta japonica]|uniref:Uncharacterized protein n=1 Tax=Eumeta variegata TaxID=151549 RepID=A0A4C1YEU5_EUMVA|nr:hypothetical protein EVAR_36097_1 [Eumeta japonica]
MITRRNIAQDGTASASRTLCRNRPFPGPRLPPMMNAVGELSAGGRYRYLAGRYRASAACTLALVMIYDNRSHIHTATHTACMRTRALCGATKRGGAGVPADAPRVPHFAGAAHEPDYRFPLHFR